MSDETPAGHGFGAPAPRAQFGGLAPDAQAADDEGMDALELQMLQNMKAQARGLRGELPDEDDGADPMARPGGRIADRETDYQKQRLKRGMTPARVDAYSMGDKTPDASTSSYADIMRRNQLAREADNTMQNILAKQKDAAASGAPPPEPAPASTGRRRNRWGEAPDAAKEPQAYGLADATPAHARWDATPGRDAYADATPGPSGLGDATPAANRWDATPTPGRAAAETPKRSRWDATPSVSSGAETPSVADATPARKRSR